MPAGFSAADFYYLLPELIAHAGRAAACSLLDASCLPRGGDPERSAATVVVSPSRPLVAAGVALHQPSAYNLTIARGLVAVDGFALFFKLLFLRVGGHHHPHVRAVSALREHEARRVLLPDPLRDARHDVRRRRHRPHHDLHRPRDDGDLVLRAGRLHPSEPSIERGGDQVLRARRVLARPSCCTACRSLRA